MAHSAKRTTQVAASKWACHVDGRSGFPRQPPCLVTPHPMAPDHRHRVLADAMSNLRPVWRCDPLACPSRTAHAQHRCTQQQRQLQLEVYAIGTIRTTIRTLDCGYCPASAGQTSRSENRPIGSCGQQHGVASRAVSSYRGVSIAYGRNPSTVEKLQVRPRAHTARLTVSDKGEGLSVAAID